MYHVSDFVHLDVSIDGNKIENGALDFQKLLLTSDVSSLLPLFQLDFADTNGEFKKSGALKDGVAVEISIGRKLDRQRTYKFRLFSVNEQMVGQFRHYRLTGYLDVPKYLMESSNKHYKGNSSEVVKQVAQAAGFTEFDVESTADSQTWYQANKRNGHFCQYLANRSFKQEGSLMAMAVRMDGTFMYKDFNAIENAEVTFAYDPSNSGREVELVAHRVLDKASGNVLRGYGNTQVQQQLDQDDPKKQKDVQVKTRGKTPAVNEQVRSSTERGRVDITPVHFKDQAHDNYYKARHQNSRGSYLNGSQLELLTPVQVDDVDLLSPVEVRLRNVNQDQDSPESMRDGAYVVIAKHVVVEGLNYAERFRLARAGINS